VIFLVNGYKKGVNFMDKQSFIEKKISEMTVEQKVGQCLVIGFAGTVVTPEIINRIKKYYPAGIRVAHMFRAKTAVHDPYATSEEFAHRVIRRPTRTMKDMVPGIPAPFTTNEEFCKFLNTMKKAALENGLGLPLHITFDMEGDASADYFHGGINYFPSAMGIGKSGEEKLAYDVAWAVARQVTPVGISWTHSPVLDVNTNPLNPEIGTRSYGETAEEASKYAVEAFKGYRDGGLITTGKHFPGRGPSAQDAHGGLPVIELSREELQEHLNSFQALIDEGIPCIMTAHTAYPALDPSGLPATLSKPILTDLLKGEMGFKGTITTDDITMGGIVAKYEVHEACTMALNAGSDLILIREEAGLIDEVFPALVEAVKSGKISEERINDAVRRTLSVKYDYGLFTDGGVKDENRASEGIKDSKVSKIALESAIKTVSVLRDEQNILPLSKETKVLLVEQIHPLHLSTNSQSCHPGILWENMFKYSENVGMVETRLDFPQEDKQRVFARIAESDVIIITNYYFRRFGSIGNDFIKEVLAFGKPVVVITNTPYSFGVQPEHKTVILTYGGSPESMAEIARKVFQ
jgi:beta-N-acetylhexosaminidase